MSDNDQQPSASNEPSAQDCAKELKSRFPALFGAEKPLPLKLRIQADIQERAPGVFTKAALSAFLRRYTGSYAYLIALTKATHRFDLDGQAVAELTEEHRQAASDELTRRRTNKLAKQEQEEQARRDRAHLLRDYERTTLTEANFCALKGIAPEALAGLLAQAKQEALERPAVAPQRPDRGQGHRADRADRSGRPGQPGGHDRRHAGGRREGGAAEGNQPPREPGRGPRPQGEARGPRGKGRE